MYKVIGTDGREYGPVSADQVRQWITEGRANAQTRAQAEGATEWRTLADLPEFHPALDLSAGSVPPPLSPPVQPHVATHLAGADKKIAAGICGILFGGFGVHKFILGYTSEGVTMLAVTLCCIPAGILTCGVGFLGVLAMHIIGIVEGILYLTKSDEDFVQTYVLNKRGWF